MTDYQTTVKEMSAKLSGFTADELKSQAKSFMAEHHSDHENLVIDAILAALEPKISGREFIRFCDRFCDSI